MKNAFIIILLAVAGFSSCKKDDEAVFDKTADERLNEALTKYQTQLVGATEGWKAMVYPKAGGVYSFYFKFNASNRVTMLSDFDSTSAATVKESSYRLKGLQQPSLLFDTYSYLHVLADPDGSVNGGLDGAGLSSDFEYFFDSTSADTIKLTGRFNGSKAILIRATQPEAQAYTSGQLLRGLSVGKISTYFKRLTIGGQLFDIQINTLNRTFTFTWIDASGVAQTFTTNYFLTVQGISFVTPLQVGNQTITGFTDMVYNAATETIDLKVNNAAATITGIVIPLKVDVNAPKRWYDQAAATDDYWISANGFQTNGVPDAYNVNSLVSGSFLYYYYIYWPNFGNGNDFCGPIFLNVAANALELVYGTAPRTPTFTGDGRAIFSMLGNYNPYPATGPAVQTRANLYSARGFYFVQTSNSTYDMVSATDGKSWITWEM